MLAKLGMLLTIKKFEFRLDPIILNSLPGFSIFGYAFVFLKVILPFAIVIPPSYILGTSVLDISSITRFLSVAIFLR